MFESSAGHSYPQVPTCDTIYDFIVAWGEGHWPLKDSYFPPNPASISQAITNGTAMIISNGSCKPLLSSSIGAASWRLECSETRATCFSECDTSALPHEVKAYHSELQGYHMGMLGLLAFCKYHQLSGGSISMGFDNDSGFDKSVDGHLKVPMKCKHVDLIQPIQIIAHHLHTEHVIKVNFLLCSRPPR
jgi:hypothetical protein